MTNFNFIRRKYQFSSFINKLYKLYGFKTLLIFALYLIGFILGVVIIMQLGEDITSDLILDESFKLFLQREYVFTSLFINYLLTYTILICYATFINKALFFEILNFCILFCLGFFCGYNFGIYITIFNFIALIFSILIILLFNFIINFLYCFLLAVIRDRNHQIKKFGKICCNDKFVFWKKLAFIISIIIAFNLFLYSLLLNIFLMFVVL